MTNKEKEFYSKPFLFSYSSLNKLIHSPVLFYKDYILNEKEEKLEKHLINGKLLHCLLFEPENLNNKFKIIPDKIPTDNVLKIIHKLAKTHLMYDLMDINLQTPILNILKEENLYQSFKEDSVRLNKIQCNENKKYWDYINDSKVNVIDQETLKLSQEQLNFIKADLNIMNTLSKDDGEVFYEKYLECKIKDKDFGLKGVIDFYKINHTNKVVTICDLKTTSKSIEEFEETVYYYNYWLQSSIYCKLVYNNIKNQDYKFEYKFIVIDKYNQVYLFDVSDKTLNNWSISLIEILDIADYHYSNNNYKLPYKLLTSKIVL
jgi:hypothetical protein